PTAHARGRAPPRQAQQLRPSHARRAGGGGYAFRANLLRCHFFPSGVCGPSRGAHWSADPAGAPGPRPKSLFAFSGWRVAGTGGALEPEERSRSSDEDAVEPASFTRRRFLKVVAGAGVVTGVLGLGALSGLGIVYRPPEPPPP